MGEKIGFIDLGSLRIGVFLDDREMPTVPNFRIVEYRPLAITLHQAIGNSITKKKSEIVYPKGSLVTVTKEELGGFKDIPFETYKVLLANEKSEPSVFMSKILPTKINDLIRQNAELREEAEIRKSISESQKSEISKELTATIENVVEMTSKLQRLTRRRPEFERRFE